MAVLHHEIHIAAPPETVWAVLADLTAVRHYNPLVQSARYTSKNKSGIGASRRCELKPNGFTEERVDAWEQGKLLGIELTDSSWPIASMRWQTTLQSTGSGTSMRQEMNYRLKFGPVGRLLDALVLRRKLTADINEIFAAFKAHVESLHRTRQGAPVVED